MVVLHTPHHALPSRITATSTTAWRRLTLHAGTVVAGALAGVAFLRFTFCTRMGRLKRQSACDHMPTPPHYPHGPVAVQLLQLLVVCWPSIPLTALYAPLPLHPAPHALPPPQLSSAIYLHCRRADMTAPLLPTILLYSHCWVCCLFLCLYHLHTTTIQYHIHALLLPLPAAHTLCLPPPPPLPFSTPYTALPIH